MPHDQSAAFARDIDVAFDRLDPPDKKGGRANYVTLRLLREALPQYDRKTFDAEIHKLRRARRYSLDASDGRHVRMTRAEQDAGIEEAGSLLVYAAQVRASSYKDNPSNKLRLGAFYLDGIGDAENAIDLDYFDLPKMAQQVVDGQSSSAVVHAAVDVYLREAEEDGSKKEWFEQNKDEVAEAEEDGLEREAVYQSWRRGWRDGAAQILAGVPLRDAIAELTAES